MTYNAGIPNATDLISTSQGQIKTNFFQLNSQFASDHVGFNTGSSNGDGTHKKVTFDAAIANPGAAGTVGVIYPQNDTATKVYPFYVNAAQATTPLQLASGLYTYTPALGTTGSGSFTYTSQTGYFYKAGGLTFFFGKIVLLSGTGLTGSLTLSLPTTSVTNGSGIMSTFFGNIGAAATVLIFDVTSLLPFTGPATFSFNGFYQ